VKPLSVALAAVALLAAVQAQSPAPWQPRPVIIVDPRPYLGSPSPHPARSAKPHPKRRVTPHARRALAHPQRTPETFERLDTSPSPAPHRR
jgi:hypothetical protein